MVLSESIWFYGLIRKSIIKERSKGNGGDERETLKELECFVPALPASNTFNNETGNKTHSHLHTQIHAHTHTTWQWEGVFIRFLLHSTDIKIDCLCHVLNHNKQTFIAHLKME